jgi:hypothetical protein
MGTFTLSGKTSLYSFSDASHVHDRAYRHSGRVHVDGEFRETPMFWSIDIGARNQHADLGFMLQRGPDLVAANEPPDGSLNSMHQISSNANAGAESARAALPYRGTAGLRAIIDRDGVTVLRPNKTDTSNFLIDDDLKLWVSAEPPGPRPMRHRVSGVGELTAGRLRILLEPSTHFDPPRGVLERQGKIHLPHLLLRLRVHFAQGSAANCLSMTRAVLIKAFVPK